MATPKGKALNKAAGKKSSGTSTATKTATATKTSTSTDAYTQGNITVTGGAGKGATTVHIAVPRFEAKGNKDKALSSKKLSTNK